MYSAMKISKDTQSERLVSLFLQTKLLLSDDQWWLLFIAGNERAFEHIYYNHINLLYDYGVSLGKNPQLAEDCVQDLFAYL